MRLVLLVCSSMILFVSCRDDSRTIAGPPGQPKVGSLTVLEKSVVASGNSFGLKLFKAVNTTDEGKNVFLSPFSVSMALGMLLNGANGATLDSMKNTLEQGNVSLQEIDDSYKSAAIFLENLDPNVTMNIANSIWYRSGFQVIPSFLNNCQLYFDAEVSALDFSAPSAVTTINNWVSSKTNDKIQTIIDVIPPDAVMYLINAIYFKANWMYKFDSTKTTDTTFASLAGTNPCRMMHQKAKFAYCSTGQEQVIDMAYGAGQFSMTVILPAEGILIDDYAMSLTQEKWSSLVGNLDSSEVILSLPKFKLEYTKTLNDELAAMGMGIIFLEPDLSRIANEPLAVSEVKHKTFVDVNEEGTEAAAVTLIGIVRTVAYPPPIPVMTVDRPFICVIREHTSGAILFVGKIVSTAQS